MIYNNHLFFNYDFFFFWENLGRGALVLFIDERNYKASLITRGAISSRIDSNQTYSSLSCLEHLARKFYMFTLLVQCKPIKLNLIIYYI